ncbi:hypothetical protein [Streptomyces lavendulae]|uniref:hypothetical protein n=1 Tax=Streptomyces lavendulae TaxID=1914 RepID=UPI0024A13D92|nr:hypothetical protein [Streptomyces lavendulae]GLX19461.1 hypothetical protein Slala01_31050 [Streptomyces lavendulae subsp. lavendulae]GLX26956.1 hypothetical protein Slala02_27760 [Streptomyces lavendulae subsp. lavendulae]
MKILPHTATPAARLIEEILQAVRRGDDRHVDLLLRRLAQVGSMRDLFELRHRLHRR